MSIEWTDWEAQKQKFMAKVAGNLVANMDAACAYAADQARAKVPRGRPELVKHITHTVEARGLTVTGRVGVDKKAYWGYFVELGTKNMAAQPFLRPAVFGNKAQIARIIRGGK